MPTETEKKTSKGMFALILILGGILFNYGFRVIMASVRMQVENMNHAGWNSAREDLKKQFQSTLEGGDFTEELKTAYVDCMADRAIAFLNNTSCSYKYNPTITKKDDHLRDQDDCVEKSGYTKELDVIASSCAETAAKKFAH